MSTDDISQIIDRLDRIEGKQDKQAEQIADLRVAIASSSGESSGSQGVKTNIMANVASYGGLLAGIGAMLAVFWRDAK